MDRSLSTIILILSVHGRTISNSAFETTQMAIQVASIRCRGAAGVRIVALLLTMLPTIGGVAMDSHRSGISIASSSSCDGAAAAAGAIDGNRISTGEGKFWRGEVGEPAWWWQIDFGEERKVGALFQINGDDELALRHAPRDYIWQMSTDGEDWVELPETRIQGEQRCFRIHRLDRSIICRALRLVVLAADDGAPALREVEFYASQTEAIDFPQWLLAVNTETAERLPFQCPLFVALAHECELGIELPAQAIDVATLNESFLAIEPTPLCAFLTGNLVDWCQQPREAWRGAKQVLDNGRLPIWASCGGAQGLAIVSEFGVEQPWDCPHCRDPHKPLLPIYTHIGHTADRACGDYSGCVFERGPYRVRQVVPDPAFAGLGEEFEVMESHCGQIAYPPQGWTLVATAGRDAKTKTQCLRRDGRFIYAAQFHIELPGTPESSHAIMNNFLQMAKQWGGYQPNCERLPSAK